MTATSSSENRSEVELEVRERLEKICKKIKNDEQLLLLLLGQLGYETRRDLGNHVPLALEQMFGNRFKSECEKLISEFPAFGLEYVRNQCWAFRGSNKHPPFMHAFFEEVGNMPDKPPDKPA